MCQYFVLEGWPYKNGTTVYRFQVCEKIHEYVFISRPCIHKNVFFRMTITKSAMIQYTIAWTTVVAQATPLKPSLPSCQATLWLQATQFLFGHKQDEAVTWKSMNNSRTLNFKFFPVHPGYHGTVPNFGSPFLTNVNRNDDNIFFYSGILHTGWQ